MSGFNYTNLQSSKRHNAVPPPTFNNVSKQGYSTMNAISQNALSAAWGGSRKRAATEDEYFEDDDEGNVPDLAYIPAPGSPTNLPTKNDDNENVDDDDEDDPLDAYMAGIEQQMANEQKKGGQNQPTAIRNDLEEEDDEESYYRYMEENPNAGVTPQEDETHPEVEYDEDGNPLPPDKKRIIDPLPPIDHSQITYTPFVKNFYREHEEISALTKERVIELRKTFDLNVSGRDAPKPVSSFAHFNFDDKLLKGIIKAEYTQPTPIQAQAVPCALAGRDVLGVAHTGSGKTAAFVWPMLVHVAAQPSITAGEGPVALILAPTRELAIQIYNEAKKFARLYDLQVVCAYGGGSKWEQSQALKAGADIVVATPGRIIDHVKSGATNLQRVTFLVLDEADRMFELGFEPQVRSVCNHVRPDRQTLLFSATFRKRIERLAKDALNDPVRITQGIIGQANVDVEQHVELLDDQKAKRDWLYERLVRFTSNGAVLVFVTKKHDAEQLAADLKTKEYECLLLHGDMEQAERNKVITTFKRKECDVLVATDVAARGLDIPHVRTVVNFDLARDVDTHTHRIGRTGRAGQRGDAYTLVTPKDKEFVGHIVKNVEAAGQDVPQSILDLALQSSWYRKQRYKNKGQSSNVGGVGLGFKEKVGQKSGSTPAGGGAAGIQKAIAKGPATDRLAAMKAAFRAQYMNQFTASSEQLQPNQMKPPPPPPPPSTTNNPSTSRKKSRWQ